MNNEIERLSQQVKDDLQGKTKLDKLVEIDDVIKQQEKVVEHKEHATFHCSVCEENMNGEMIQLKEQHGYTVAYADCPECNTEHILMVESAASRKIKKKVRALRKIEQYLELAMMHERLKSQDDYYEQEYLKLTDEERELVGDYYYEYPKDIHDSMEQTLNDTKYTVKDLWVLL